MVALKSLSLALGAIGVSSFAVKEGKNPIRRVVTLMQDMQKEIEAEGEKEDDLYKKFKCYCEGNTEHLSKAGEEAASQIEELSAKVKEEKALKKQTEEELKQHKSDRTNAKQDLAEATKLREKEHAQYVEDSGESNSNIEATKGAIKALEKGSGATAFIQSPFASQIKAIISSLDTVDANDRDTVMNFLQQSGDYVPAAGQIIGILKNMLDEMDKALNGIVSEEDAAVKSFKSLKAAKEKEIALATSSIEAKTQRVGELAVSIVQNENGKKDATADLEDSQKFLANLAATCKEKAAEYEERVKLRNDELQALSEAIAVLNDDDALDVFKSSLSLSQQKMSFLGGSTRKNTSIAKAKQMIKSSVQKSKNNPAISLMAHTITNALKTGTQVDFSKVIKMIDDMVSLLKKEQVDDETHKEYCEKEFDSSDDEKKATEQKITQLTSSISSMKDEISSLSEKIAALVAENEALDKSVAEATSQRKQENKDFTETVQLNQTAIKLIFKAKNRLQKFYNPDQHIADEPKPLTEEEQMHSFKVSFLQMRKKNNQQVILPDPAPAPEVSFGGAKTQKSNSVMALMDKLTKELEVEIQEAEHNEKTAVKEYEELVADAQENKAANTKSITDKTKSKADLESNVEEAKTNHITASDALANINNYIKDLHASCDFIVANFEVRRESRTSEIDGLKSAKAVLSGADYSM